MMPVLIAKARRADEKKDAIRRPCITGQARIAPDLRKTEERQNHDDDHHQPNDINDVVH